MPRLSYTAPLFCLTLATALAAGCMNANMDVKVPTPPNMDPLLQSYSLPSAPFSQETLEELLTQAQTTFQKFESFGGLAPITEALFGTDESSESALQALGLAPHPELAHFALSTATNSAETTLFPVDVGGQQVEGDGYLEIERTCAGWSATPTPDRETNGSVKLTLVFRDTGIEAVVWGKAHNCKYLVGGKQLELNGEVNIHTGSVLQSFWSPNGTGQETPALELLVDFKGTMLVDNAPAASNFDFRLLVSVQRLEFNLNTPQGNLLFFLQQDQQGFVAANGTWACNFDTRTCVQQ